jgi:hypothetical protein
MVNPIVIPMDITEMLLVPMTAFISMLGAMFVPVPVYERGDRGRNP